MPALVTFTSQFIQALQTLYAKTAFATEDGNQSSVLNTFSYAGGSSAYSFGLYQYDLGNKNLANPTLAQTFLLNNGFTTTQLGELSQPGTLDQATHDALNTQLQNLLSTQIGTVAMDNLNNTYFTSNLEPNAEGFLQETIVNNPSIAGQLYSSPVAIQHILDFANQFGSATSLNAFTTFLSGETVQFNSSTPAVSWNPNLSADANVQAFIMATPYGAGATSAGPDTHQSEINRENAFHTAIANETITPTGIEVSAQSGAGGNAATLTNLQDVAVAVDSGITFTIGAASGNDTITGGGNDVFGFAPGSGANEITNYKTSEGDSLQFTGGQTLTGTRDFANLVIQEDSIGDKVTVDNFFATTTPDTNGLYTLNLTINGTPTPTLINPDGSLAGGDILLGTDGNDTFTISNGTHSIYGFGGINEVVYTGAAGAMNIQLGPVVGTAATADPIHDTLYSIQNVVGSNFDDTITGSRSGGNVLDGGAGNDTIIGNGDHDTLIGGSGNDLVMVNGQFDTVVYTSGTDTIGGNGHGTLILPSGVTLADIMYRPSAEAQFQPNLGDSNIGGINGQIIIGNLQNGNMVQFDQNSIQNVVLDGGAGPTLSISALQSLAGNISHVFATDPNNPQIGAVVDMTAGGYDQAVGTPGNDYFYAEPGDMRPLIMSSTSDTYRFFNPPPGQPHYDFSGGNDTFIGGGGDDLIMAVGIDLTANGGDTIYGNGGDDRLFAGYNSFVSGGDGNDGIVVGSGSIADGGAGNDEVGTAGNNTILTGGDGNDYMFANGSNNYVDGGNGDDSISEGVGRNNTIVGGSGNDNILSMGLAANINGGDGNDVITLEPRQAGTGPADYSFVDGGAGNDTITVEDFSSFPGSPSNNGATLRGGDGNDLIQVFGNGTYVLDGGAGDDVLIGGGGNDTFIAGEGQGNDSYNGGGGVNTITYESNTLGVVVDLLHGTADSVEDNHDTITNIQNVVGGSGNDTIIGNGANNVLNGGGGNDTYILNLSAGGHDTIIDTSGTDKIVFSDITDTGQINVTRNGDNVVLTDTVTGNSVTVQNWFVLGGSSVASIELRQTGVSITADQLTAAVGNGGIIVLNHAPTAVNDVVDAQHQASASGNVLTNDSDTDGDKLTAVAETLTTANGSHVVLNADGTFTIQAALGFRGNDSFGYTVDDGHGLQASATVTVDNLFTNRAPTAVNETVSAAHSAAASGNVLTSDSDPDGDSITAFMEDIVTAHHGHVVLQANGQYTYTAAAGYAGSDSFGYEIQDQYGATANASVEIDNIYSPPSITLTQAHLAANVTAVLTSHHYVPGTPVFPTLQEGHAVAASLINGVNPANLTLENSFDVKVNFVSGNTTSKDTLGYYTIDADGTLSNVHFLAANLSSANPNSQLSDLGVLPQGTTLGFFIVADGFNANNAYSKFDLTHGHLEFINPTNHSLPATLSDNGQHVQLVYVNDVTGQVSQVNGNVYNSDSTSLNADGVTHALSGIDASGNLQIGFEDANKGGDKDYNDAVIEVQMAPHVTHALAPIALLTGVALSDTGTFATATVAFTAGHQTGDQLIFNNTALAGTNITETTNTDGSVTFTGSDTSAHYQQALAGLQYGSTAADPAAGLRSFSISVTDDQHLSNNSTLDVNVNDSGIAAITSPGGGEYSEVDATLSHSSAFTAETGSLSPLDLTAQAIDSLHHGVMMKDGAGNGNLTVNIEDILDTGDDLFVVLGSQGHTLAVTGATLTNHHTETHNGNLYDIYNVGTTGVILAVEDTVTVHAQILAG